jgi:hypothetical protein
VASEAGAGQPEPSEPRPPLGAWPRLYAVVLLTLLLEIALLRLLPALLARAAP